MFEILEIASLSSISTISHNNNHHQCIRVFTNFARILHLNWIKLRKKIHLLKFKQLYREVQIIQRTWLMSCGRDEVVQYLDVKIDLRDKSVYRYLKLRSGLLHVN